MNDGAREHSMLRQPLIRYAHYVVGLLLVVYICNQSDRVLVVLLMQPIKKEFDLTDTQLGFLAGPALSILYTVLGIPIARWADRSNRVNIMSGAIALWSAVTVSFSVVTSFWQLAAAQIGVGIGEAGFTAIAISLIADYYPDASARMRALSVFTLAVPISGVLSGVAAGWINEIYGWRAVFVFAGVPGLLLALLLKGTIGEPNRNVVSLAVSTPSGHGSLKLILQTLVGPGPLRHLAVGACLANVVACLFNWLPAYLIRNRGLSTSEADVWYAMISGIGGGVGIWLSGRLAAHRGAGVPRATRLVATAVSLVLPTLALSLWGSPKYVSLVSLVVCQALMYFFLAPTLAMVQELSPPNIRATMMSLFILIEVLAGALLGVQLVGTLSDALKPLLGSDSRALQWSLTAISVLSIWSAVHFWLAGRRPLRDGCVEFGR